MYIKKIIYLTNCNILTWSVHTVNFSGLVKFTEIDVPLNFTPSFFFVFIAAATNGGLLGNKKQYYNNTNVFCNLLFILILPIVIILITTNSIMTYFSFVFVQNPIQYRTTYITYSYIILQIGWRVLTDNIIIGSFIFFFRFLVSILLYTYLGFTRPCHKLFIF